MDIYLILKETVHLKAVVSSGSSMQCSNSNSPAAEVSALGSSELQSPLFLRAGHPDGESPRGPGYSVLYVWLGKHNCFPHFLHG